MIEAELFKRIITAVILVGVVVSGIFLLESLVFSIAVGLISAAAAWEWARLAQGKADVYSNIVFGLAIGVGVPVLFVFPLVLPWVVGSAIIWWIIVAILIAFVGAKGRHLQVSWWSARKSHAWLVIFPAAIAITGLHAMGPDGRWYLLACLVIVWTTDSSAYMVGRLYGKTLLAPRISPAKTLEGAAGGLVGASIVALILYETLPIEMIFSRFDWVVLTAVTAIFSVIGDLTESMYKRAAGLKDSGSIFPGHGGILDRMDSTFASAPVFVAGILFAAR
jgi:phosphatidate cytidylyltransferase